MAEVKRDSEDDAHRFTLPGLKPGHFPIAPKQTAMKLTNLHRKGLPYGDITVARRMPRVLPAQSVTGHGDQGMTLPKVVVDVAHPPPQAGGAPSRVRTPMSLCHA